MEEYVHKCTKCGEIVTDCKDFRDCAGHYEWIDSYYACKCGNKDKVTFDIK